MRPPSVRKAIALISTVAVVAVTLVGAAASAATIFSGAIQINLGPSFPDPQTWALMLASFGLIGAGVRSRRRTVVLS
jgi:predicted ATPase